MIRSPEEILDELVSLRDPLSRVLLAAGQLEIEPPRPDIVANVTAEIREAVSEMDQRIRAMIEALDPVEEDTDQRDDVGGELQAVVARVAPALSARGVECELRLDAAMSVAPRLLSRLRRGALRLLRVGGLHAAPRGRMRLELLGDGERIGLRLVAENATPVGRPDGGDALASVRRLALAHGAELSVPVAPPETLIALLWYAREEPT